MHFSGSGTESDHTYTYNDKDQITVLTNMEEKFILTYNATGNLKQIKVVGEWYDKIYDFKYQWSLPVI